MADHNDWLRVQLDSNHRHGLADLVDARIGPDEPESARLVRVLRSSRNDLLLDRSQADIVLRALNVDGALPALRARLEAFLRAA